ncbi:MAG: hypothetical protein JSW54_02155 [Fidelibacterota bacterium]|nr:MAG: hypothetical protein JSW54_02155 [Candidatus Neomarinimicrobiota bacterium]
MNASNNTDAPYIVRPSGGLAEGEIDLGRTHNAVDEKVTSFILQLLTEALNGGSSPESPQFSISSLSIQRSGGILTGRIYGQAWAEKQGDTVSFLRAKLFNDQGAVVITGMATCHRSKRDQPE